LSESSDSLDLKSSDHIDDSCSDPIDDSFSNSIDRREVWKLAWPVLIGMGSHIFFHLVDLYWIGYLGRSALAGVAAAGSLMMLLWTGTRIAHTGGVAVMSQAFGREDDQALRKGAADALIVAAFTGTVIFFLIYPLFAHVVTFYSLGLKAHSAAMAYLAIALCGIPFLYLLEGVSSYIIGVGETRVLMIMGIITSVINAILDPLLMFGWYGFPKMGIAGAALASVISTALLFFSLFGWQRFHLGLLFSDYFTSFKRVKRVVTIGLPDAIKDISRPCAVIVMIRLLSFFGDDIVAAYGLSARIMGLVIIYLVALNVALTTLTGRLIGQGKVDQVHNLLCYGARSGLAVHSITIVFLMIFAGSVLSVFDKSGLVVAEGIPVIRIFVVMMTFPLMSNVIGAAFKGSGNTTPVMIATVGTHWLVQVPLACLAVFYFKASIGVWLAITCARIIEMIILAIWYHKGHWKLYPVQ